MKTINVQQGSPEWHEHRARHFNASDAPAMLGVSPYKTRAQLVRERATGVAPEIDAATQRRFDDGHRYEALARPLAEAIIGEELYPCTGVNDRYSASFDGLTMLEDVAFEHKTLNDDLRNCMRDEGNGWDLPKHYRVQMEHQLMVSGAERVLFMASKWDGDNLLEERHCWYASDPKLRAELVAGWEQFAADVAAYETEAADAPAPVARPVEGFGALMLQVEGRVVACNLDAFRAQADAFIRRLPKPHELQTDQDFADAESAVKACTDAESRIKAAKDAALAGMADVDAVLRAADVVVESIRAARLALDRSVKAEKDNRRAALVQAGVDAVRQHFVAINATLGDHALGLSAALSADIGASIKGLKSLSSMRDKIDAAVAAAKIHASQRADQVRACIAVLAEFGEHAALFPDRVALCASKSPDDLRNLAVARIAEHERQQVAKLEAEREKIRAEEAARIEREQRETELKAATAMPDTTPAAEVSKPAPAPVHSVPVAADRPGVRIKLGDIVAAIAPLSITADGLAQLGFQPVATDKAAKLYAASDLPRILRTLSDRLAAAARQQVAA